MSYQTKWFKIKVILNKNIEIKRIKERAFITEKEIMKLIEIVYRIQQVKETVKWVICDTVFVFTNT